MSSDHADVIGHDGANLCRCKGCKQIYRAGGNAKWHNHFWCPSCIEIPQARMEQELQEGEDD